MVAGGYGDGAWLRSVEFFDFKKGLNFFNDLMIQKFIATEQYFSTGLPRHTSVPWNLFRCAAKS
jgi:hypothetical protein